MKYLANFFRKLSDFLDPDLAPYRKDELRITITADTSQATLEIEELEKRISSLLNSRLVEKLLQLKAEFPSKTV